MQDLAAKLLVKEPGWQGAQGEVAAAVALALPGEQGMQKEPVDSV